MSSALTKEYAERTVVNKTSLDIKKIDNSKTDTEAYQSFVR